METFLKKILEFFQQILTCRLYKTFYCYEYYYYSFTHDAATMEKLLLFKKERKRVTRNTIFKIASFLFFLFPQHHGFY